MRTHTHHLTAALVAALIDWSGPAPLPATEYEVSDYLPLAVGNSWTFGHEWYLNEGDGVEELDDRFIRGDWPAYEATWGGRFTITVERTEVIDGKTYYVLSGMPSGGWPPAPPHFLAGKKLRWEGTSLVEHDGTGEQTFFRFDGSGGRGTGYTIPTTEDDNRVTSVWNPWGVVSEYYFDFHGHDGYRHDDYGNFLPAWRIVGFVAGYGIAYVRETLNHEHSPIPSFENALDPIQATLTPQQSGGAGGQSGSRVVMYEDARYGTSAPSSSWGQVKGEER